MQVLGKNHVIKCLDKCDFTPMYDHFMAEREAKKSISKEEKLKQKEEKEAAEAKYKTAYVDGRAEPVSRVVKNRVNTLYITAVERTRLHMRSVCTLVSAASPVCGLVPVVRAPAAAERDSGQRQ